ncbi:MAG: hypothetical protein GTO04_15210 [Planctomycetales bacterium]|nr:hypothetical protein [Planctomycetales bacterium]
MFTIPCESIINTHPAVYRSALVGVGSPGEQIPVVFAEPWPKWWPSTSTKRQRLARELAELAASHPLTDAVEHIFIRRSLPVDIRHNAKIFREQLAIEATRQLKRVR